MGLPFVKFLSRLVAVNSKELSGMHFELANLQNSKRVILKTIYLGFPTTFCVSILMICELASHYDSGAKEIFL